MGAGAGHFSYTAGADGTYVLTAPLSASATPYTISGELVGTD